MYTLINSNFSAVISSSMWHNQLSLAEISDGLLSVCG
jgi:hypothetical protein